MDVGAGTGVLANEIANISDDVFALEPNGDRVEYIKKKFPQVKAFDGSAESISFPEAYFTKVYILSALHHFSDQDGALYEINRVLKTKGVLVIFDLPPGKSTVERRLPTIKFLAPEELEGKLDLAGFTDVEVKYGEKGYFVRAKKS